MLRSSLLTLLGLGVLASIPAIAGGDREQTFERAYRSRRPAERLVAVRSLLHETDETSTRLLAARVLESEEDEAILLETVQGLRVLREGPARDPLFAAFRTARGGHRIRLARTLAPMTGSRVRALLVEMAKADEPCERVLALGGLAGRKGDEVRRALVAGLRDPVWEARSAAVDGLAALDDPESLAGLVDAIEGERGRLREDIVRTLQGISGAGIGADPELWRRWLAAHPEGRVAPSPLPGPPPSICPLLGCPTGRNVFVIDLSRSMAEPVDADPGTLRTLVEEGFLPARRTPRRIDLARALLRRSVDGLRPGARLDLVVMVDAPWTVHGSLVPATPRNVKRVTGRIENLSPTGPTDILGALRTALALRPVRGRDEGGPVGADRIVLISEGFPSGGRTVDRATIVAHIREAFLGRRVRIDTVGVGASDVELLEALARATGGRFTRVGE